MQYITKPSRFFFFAACCCIGVSFSSPKKIFRYKNAERHSTPRKTEDALIKEVYGDGKYYEKSTQKMNYEEADGDRPQRKDDQGVKGSSGLQRSDGVTSTTEGSTLIEYYYVHTMTV